MTSNRYNSKPSSGRDNIDHNQGELRSTELEFEKSSNNMINWIKSLFSWQTNINSELNWLKSRIKDISLKNEQLEEENQKLEARISTLEQENHNLQGILGQIIPVVTKQNQPHDSTFNPASTTPQHFELKKSFELYRDNNFQSLSRKLFKTCPDDSTLKQGQEKKYAIVQIHKILAEEILIKGIELFETDPSKCRGDLSEIINNFIKSVSSSLEKNNIDIAKDNNYVDFQALVKESITLVRDMTMADPPGRLLWQKENNETFDPKKHEPKLRSEDSGLISLMYHPGYIVGDDISLKSWVITEPRQSFKPGKI